VEEIKKKKYIWNYEPSSSSVLRYSVFVALYDVQFKSYSLLADPEVNLNQLLQKAERGIGRLGVGQESQITLNNGMFFLK
jgi:hypothetical protein